MKLKPCPFCGEVPELENKTAITNYDDAENSWWNMRELPAQRITCNNVKGCDVRPSVYRVNVKDAVKIWNTRK